MDSDSLEERIGTLELEFGEFKNNFEALAAATSNAVTTEQLEKAKSDLRAELIWKLVMWNVIIIFGIFGIIAVVVGVLAYLGQQSPPAT